MSNLSVRSASEAAIGIATLRKFAATDNNPPSLAAMIPEIIADKDSARTIRATIQALASREQDWLKERATHATVSARVNERRARELASMAAVHAATMTTLRLGHEIQHSQEAAHELREAFIEAIRGVDEFPMGTSAKQSLKAQLTSEVELAAAEGDQPFVRDLLAQAESVYLVRVQEAVWANYDQPDSPSM